ncbi:uncharacterized protein HaLaN_13476, partial [Haematococcus lacustris]
MTVLSKEEQADALSKFMAAGFVGPKQKLVPRLSNQELESIGIQPQSVRSALLHAFADGELYRGIVLYTPFGKDRYLQRNLKQTTHKQLAAKLAAKGYDTVAVVDSMPLQLLGPDCDGARDIDDVEPVDGIQLAVVLNAEQTPLNKLAERMFVVEEMVGESVRCMSVSVRALHCSPFFPVTLCQQRSEADHVRRWALQCRHLSTLGGSAGVSRRMRTGAASVRPYRFKEIMLKQGCKIRHIKIDGMAVSDTDVVLVDRKSIINMQHVNELVEKLEDY